MGCDAPPWFCPSPPPYFNPRTHVGCDPKETHSSSSFSLFQSTHPRGVRLGSPNLPNLSEVFQSTHPRGVRPTAPDAARCLKNFNPRTHVGCDISGLYSGLVALLFQSTHPRGVRLASLETSLTSPKFQSTHPRGVRHSITLRTFFEQTFQSTHPRGVRRGGRGGRGQVEGISIHAPTWGATQYPYNLGNRQEFQSTHPRGVRLVFSLLIDKFTLFQSTHPRGVRRRRQGTKKASILFQSTLPRGVRRFSCLRIFENHSISIHAPTWGAT